MASGENPTLTSDDLLAIRDQERFDLLGRIVNHLKNDQRVRAAWLSGSVSRGDHDGLSDLDLSVVVTNEAASDFNKNRRAYVVRPARPVLVMDNLANAPPNGAYLLVFYAGEVGPQHVDWFWQPESKAAIPDDEKVLFDRAGLPVIPGAEWRNEAQRPPGPPLGPSPMRVEVLTHKIKFFWAMSLIVAKYIARRDGETVARMTSVIARTLSGAVDLLDSNLPLPGCDAVRRTTIGREAPTAQFELLYGLARDATGLHQRLEEEGVAIPSQGISHIYRFFDLTQSMATLHVKPPGTGERQR